MSSKNTLGALFQGAVESGSLSQESATALSVPDLGAKIQSGLGITNLDDVSASEIVLVAMLIDDSGSMSSQSKKKGVIEGHNRVLDALLGSKQSSGVYVHTRYLHGKVLYPFVELKDAVYMSDGNFNPCGGTPLFKQAKAFFGTVMAEYLKYSSAGIPVRSICLLVSDGEDTEGGNLDQLKTLADDMRQTGDHILSGVGIQDKNDTVDYKSVFSNMGVPKEWILEAKDAHGLRAAFALFSKSAVAVSKSATSFQSTSAGGFAAPVSAGGLSGSSLANIDPFGNP